MLLKLDLLTMGKAELVQIMWLDSKAFRLCKSIIFLPLFISSYLCCGWVDSVCLLSWFILCTIGVYL